MIRTYRSIGIALITTSNVALSGVPSQADSTVWNEMSVERAKTKERIETLIRSTGRLHAADRKMRAAYDSALRTNQMAIGFLEEEQSDWLSIRNAGVVCEDAADEIACFEQFIMLRTDQLTGRRLAAIEVGGEYIEMAQALADRCWMKAGAAMPGRGVRSFMDVDMGCLEDVIVRTRKLYGSTLVVRDGEYRAFDEKAYREGLNAYLLRFSELAQSLLICRGCGSIWIEIINSHSRQILQSLMAIAAKSYSGWPKHLLFNPMSYEKWKPKP